MTTIAETGVRDALQHRGQSLVRHLQHGTQFFVQDLPAIGSRPKAAKSTSKRVPGECHLAKTHQQATVGAIVVGQQRTLAQQLLHQPKEGP